MFNLIWIWYMNQEVKMGKREQKRADLEKRLINSALSRVKEHTLMGVRARDVTSDAGCSLGALYNVFDDLDMLILHVNSITLQQLGEHLAASIQDTQSPIDNLVALAKAYASFAWDNFNQWSALFEHRMPDGGKVPDWHIAEHAILFENITRPIGELLPNATATQKQTITRTMFASTHGIVSVGIHERLATIPRAELDDQLEHFVTTFVKGLC